jgi:hypothetical protein
MLASQQSASDKQINQYSRKETTFKAYVCVMENINMDCNALQFFSE